MTTVKSTPLKCKRLERGLSLSQVARDTGISRNIINRIENDKQVPSRDDARMLYKYFDKEVDLVNIYEPFFDQDLKIWAAKEIKA